MPTLRDVITLREILEKSGISGVVEFGSHLTPSDRREAFHLASHGNASIVVGTRSAIFSPMLGLQEIVVLDEYSPHHHENKSPFWNTRDVAVSRSEIEGVSLVFVGNSASLELLRLVESGWIKTKNRASLLSRPKRRLIVTSPDSYHSVIKDGLARGPVLLSVVEKHYSNVFKAKMFSLVHSATKRSVHGDAANAVNQRSGPLGLAQRELPRISARVFQGHLSS